jgi:hypothetical protein
MRNKSTEKPDDPEELVESMILGVTSDGECVYIHNFDDDIQALEFLESLTAGFRCEVLYNLIRRTTN